MNNNKEQIFVRHITLADGREVEQLYDMLLNTSSNSITTNESIKKICNDSNNHILVALVDNHVVGTIQVTICNSMAFDGRPHAVVEYFIVHPNYRKRGIGSKLFHEAEQICINQNVSCILLVSGSERKEAHAFYRKMGYDNSVKGFRRDFE